MIASIRGKKPHVYRVIILKQMADHMWGLGTCGCETRDLRTPIMGRGRVGRGRGEVKYRDAGDTGCESDNYCKSWR